MDNLRVENHAQISMKRLSSHNPSLEDDKKPVKRYKSLLTCVVCNGDAHGHNFDAISCESCKAFFRRNALRPPEKLKCRNSGQCDVTIKVKRRCKKCRLQKCLNAGMRKEWILSEKEREDKRKKIEENRRLKQIHDDGQDYQTLRKRDSKTDDDLSLDLFPTIDQSLLTVFEWFTIQTLQTSYDNAVKLNQIAGISVYPSTQPIESTLEWFRVPLYITSMRLISYIKQMSEFQELNKDDQVYLVKSNLLTICFFHSVYIYDPRTDNYHEQNTTDPLFSGKDWIKTFNKQFHSEMKQIRNDLIDIFQSDDIIIKLFYLIILFSNQISLNPSLQRASINISSLNIFKSQNVFTDLVYRYCLHQYDLSKASILFLRYINKIMKIQQLVDEIKYTIHDYIDVAQLSPLMQSLIA